MILSFNRFFMVPLSVVLVQFIGVLTIHILLKDGLDAPDLLDFCVSEIIGSQIPHPVITAALSFVVAFSDESSPLLTHVGVGVLVLEIEFNIQFTLIEVNSLEGTVPAISSSAFTVDGEEFVSFRAVVSFPHFLDNPDYRGFLDGQQLLFGQSLDYLQLLLRLVTLKKFYVNVCHSVRV